ncbi:MAG TPA: hypothetical protein VN855_00590 [Candidatus Acidoferrum sp.]|nr:hypothetical protein [Candidatus Acidoferrum sp.]
MKRQSKLKGALFTKEWWEGADTNNWNEEGKKLYLGKYFYEIVKSGNHTKLYGPLRGIYYANPANLQDDLSNEYKFVQIYNGSPIVTFTENEILVTDKLL